MVLAILNLIFGCLQLIGVVIGIILVAMIFNLSPAPLPAAPADPTDPIGAAKEQYQFLMNESPNYKNFNIAGTVVGVIDALLLIVSGIGLLKMQKWARAACFMYVALGLVFTAISTSYQFTAIVPATEKYEKERNAKLTALKKPTPPAMAGITATAGAGLNAFCGFWSCSVCSWRHPRARHFPARPSRRKAALVTSSTTWMRIAPCDGAPRATPTAPATTTPASATPPTVEREGA